MNNTTNIAATVGTSAVAVKPEIILTVDALQNMAIMGLTLGSWIYIIAGVGTLICLLYNLAKLIKEIKSFFKKEVDESPQYVRVLVDGEGHEEYTKIAKTSTGMVKRE